MQYENHINEENEDNDYNESSQRYIHPKELEITNDKKYSEQLYSGGLRVQQRVRQGSHLLRAQSDQIRSMHRAMDVQEDVLHTTKRVRRAVTVSGAFLNLFISDTTVKPLKPVVGGDPELTDRITGLNLNEDADQADQIYSVLSQIRNESQEHYEILIQQTKDLDTLNNKVQNTTSTLKTIKPIKSTK